MITPTTPNTPNIPNDPNYSIIEQLMNTDTDTPAEELSEEEQAQAMAALEQLQQYAQALNVAPNSGTVTLKHEGLEVSVTDYQFAKALMLHLLASLPDTE